MKNEKQWWQTAVCYQIYPRSFSDSTNNGIGDLRGIINRLDYLKDLGIDVKFLRENGFDKISEDHNIKNIYFGNYNKKDWKVIRGIAKRFFQENVAKIKEIGIENVKKQDKELYSFMLRQRRICNRA